MGKKKILKEALFVYKLDNGFVRTELRKCPVCGGEIEETNIDTINYGPCELDYFCKKCDKIVGHWAYGTISDISCGLSDNVVKKIIQKRADEVKKNG